LEQRFLIKQKLQTTIKFYAYAAELDLTSNPCRSLIGEIAVKYSFIALLESGNPDGVGNEILDLQSTPVVISVEKASDLKRIELVNQGNVVRDIDIPASPPAIESAVETVRMIDVSLLKGPAILKMIERWALVTLASIADHQIENGQLGEANRSLEALKYALLSWMSEGEAHIGLLDRSAAIGRIGFLEGVLK
jgi:hypothetical protein